MSASRSRNVALVAMGPGPARSRCRAGCGTPGHSSRVPRKTTGRCGAAPGHDNPTIEGPALRPVRVLGKMRKRAGRRPRRRGAMARVDGCGPRGPPLRGRSADGAQDGELNLPSWPPPCIDARNGGGRGSRWSVVVPRSRCCVVGRYSLPCLDARTRKQQRDLAPSRPARTWGPEYREDGQAVADQAGEDRVTGKEEGYEQGPDHRRAADAARIRVRGFLRRRLARRARPRSTGPSTPCPS